MAKLTTKQVIEINDILKQHLRQDADGDWEYDTPLWSDRKISNKFKVSYWHVMNLRRQMYGDMKKGSGSGWSSSAWVHAAELESHVTELESHVTELNVHLLKLEMRIACIEKFMRDDWGYELSPPKEEENK